MSASVDNSSSLDRLLKNNINSDKIPENSPINLFCTYKSEINNQNENGWTPIYRSVLSNNLEALEELLKLGANPNIPNNMNETPLYQSVDMENYDAFIILLKYNSDCNISKKNGNCPLHIATQKLNINFISELLKNGANPNLQNKLYNQTPVHITICKKGNKDILNLLFKYNGDVYNIKDKYDKTPFDYAIENGEEYKNMVEEIFIRENSSNNNINEELIDNKNNDNIKNNIKDVKEETPKKNDSTIKFSEKFSSSELINGGDDFNESSKSKLIFIKDENGNISNSTNKNKEIVKNIISQTIMKINVNDDTSHFNLSTPRDTKNNFDENSNNINIYTQKKIETSIEEINNENNINILNINNYNTSSNKPLNNFNPHLIKRKGTPTAGHQMIKINNINNNPVKIKNNLLINPKKPLTPDIEIKKSTNMANNNTNIGQKMNNTNNLFNYNFNKSVNLSNNSLHKNKSKKIKHNINNQRPSTAPHKDKTSKEKNRTQNLHNIQENKKGINNYNKNILKLNHRPSSAGQGKNTHKNDYNIKYSYTSLNGNNIGKRMEIDFGSKHKNSFSKKRVASPQILVNNKVGLGNNGNNSKINIARYRVPSPMIKSNTLSGKNFVNNKNYMSYNMNKSASFNIK